MPLGFRRVHAAQRPPRPPLVGVPGAAAAPAPGRDRLGRLGAGHPERLDRHRARVRRRPAHLVDHRGTSGFPNDYALALADAPGATDPAQMLYVQIPSAFRSAWGLKTNPGLLGRQIDVTGTLSAYFSRPGLTSSSAFAFAGGADPDPDPDPDVPPTGGTDEYDDTYWRTAIGKTGPALEAALHTIISTDVTRLSYDGVWDALKVTDQRPRQPGNVIAALPGLSMAKSPTTAAAPTSGTASTCGPSPTATSAPPPAPAPTSTTCAPSDVTVNSDRGNLDFDEGGTAERRGARQLRRRDSWEPRDAVKGDVARMILYMSVRYEGDDGFPDLEANDVVANGSAPLHGRLSVLLQWNAQDPPDAARAAPQRRHLRRPTRTTGTRSSTTPSGPTRSGDANPRWPNPARRGSDVGILFEHVFEQISAHDSSTPSTAVRGCRAATPSSISTWRRATPCSTAPRTRTRWSSGRPSRRWTPSPSPTATAPTAR